jgi:preprotein translocase subunit SecE
VTEGDEADAGQERPQGAADRRSRRSDAPSDGRPFAGTTRSRGTAVREGRPGKGSLPSRFVRFLREVVAELRKVIWPTRNQLVTYTIVVLVFVSFMVALVSLLDYVFGRGVLFLFGT